MESITLEAERLEAKLVAACRDESYNPDALEVLSAAAWEVAELEYELENGHLSNIWWTNGSVLRRGLGSQDA